MDRAVRRSVLYGEDCRKSSHLHICRSEMKQAVERNRRHQMNEEAVKVSKWAMEGRTRGSTNLVTLSKE